MRGHEEFLETTIAGPSAMHCHCQATQEAENGGNLIQCLAMPSFVHMQQTHTHTHTHIQEDFCREFATWHVSQTQGCTDIFNCEPLRHE